MVRSAVYRTSKYTAKINGDVAKQRIDAQKDSMVAQATAKFGLIVTAEEAAKTLLNNWGVSTVEVPSYLNFARQCMKVAANHSGNIAVNEICLKFDTWVARALDPYYLQEICEAVTGIDIGSCTA